MKKNKRTPLVITVVLAAAIGLLGFNNFVGRRIPEQDASASVPCINPALPTPSQYHIHPHLRIVINDEPRAIPGGIGLAVTDCERAVHTHDATGEIHIEPNFYQEFTLADFFGVWGKPFSKDQLLDFASGDGHEIVMAVDGRISQNFERLVLKDGQDILIEYRKTGVAGI